MRQMAHTVQHPWEPSVQDIASTSTLHNVCFDLWHCSFGWRDCTLMEKPQGYDDMKGPALTFDSVSLYPRLWINDSKGPHPRGLMHCAELGATLSDNRGRPDCWYRNINCYQSYCIQLKSHFSVLSVVCSAWRCSLYGFGMLLYYPRHNIAA